jgi:uncharacterized protein YukE
MVRIIMTPEKLEELARRMAQTAAQLRDLEGGFSRALSGLDWQARHQANIESQVNAARSYAKNLAEEAERLSRFLGERAAAFRQADAQGAEGLGATTQEYLRAAQNLLPKVGGLLSYMSAGRVATQKFLDLLGIRRYGPLAPWLKIGVLDQRYKFTKAVGKIGMGVGIVSDVLSADEINEKSIGVAVIRNVGEHALAAAVPGAAIVMAGNAMVQIVGTGLVLANQATIPLVATSTNMAEDLYASTGRLEAAFKRVDLSRITKGVSEIVYDVTIGVRINAIKDAWKEPNIQNLGRLFMALYPLTPVMPLTAQERQDVWQDVKKLGADVFDLAKGVPDLLSTIGSHTALVGAATISKAVQIMPIPDEWQHNIQQTCEAFIDFSVSHPITVDTLPEVADTIASALPLLGYPPNVSWVNSIQFTPVLATA